jgi:hypothetical protein
MEGKEGGGDVNRFFGVISKIGEVFLYYWRVKINL